MHVVALGLYLSVALFARGSAWDEIPSASIAAIFLAPPILFYSWAFWLLPRYLKQKRLLRFAGLSALVTVSVFFVYAFVLVRSGVIEEVSGAFPSADIWNIIFYNLCGLALILAVGYWFVKDWIQTTTAVTRLKAERLELELAFLKAQINPHFIFNTLNSLYAIALEEESDVTAESISTLASLMRYNLHESQASRIPVTSEIEYLEKYLSLQQLRITPNNRVVSDFSGSYTSNEMIAPALLITFIENAFKYGISSSRETRIDVIIRENDGELTLRVENDVVEAHRREESSGIGLENVRKRLDLEYPGLHDLEIRETDGRYSVELKLRLDP